MLSTVVHPIPGVLSKAREAAGLSYRELAAACEAAGTPVNLSTLSMVLKRGRGCTEDRATAICKALNVPLATAFTHHNGDPIGGAA